MAAVGTGTRPGLHGQTLISMGLVDLDRLLGGGLALSTILLVLEDAHSQQHLNIMKYFIAEGVACQQRVKWLTPCLPPGGASAFLPAQATPSQAAEEEAKGSVPELKIAWQYAKYEAPPRMSGASSSSTSSQRPPERSSFKRAGTAGSAVEAGIARQWCHSYDLTRSAGEQATVNGCLDCTECSGAGALQCADEVAAKFLSSVGAAGVTGPGSVLAPGAAGPGPGSGLRAAAQQQQQGAGVGRLVVESLGSSLWSPVGPAASPATASYSYDVTSREADRRQQQQAEAVLLQLLYNLKQRLQDSRCAVLVTLPAGLLSASCLQRAQHLADAVLSLDSLADNSPVYKLLPDAASAVALLSVRKACSVGMVGPRAPDPQLYVVRNRRRRLALGPVEVDPDAEERQAKEAEQAAAAAAASGSGGRGAGGGGSSRKGAASLVCGTGSRPGPGAAMDF